MQESQHAGMIDERRMAITIAAIAAESSEATNRDIMSVNESTSALIGECRS